MTRGTRDCICDAREAGIARTEDNAIHDETLLKNNRSFGFHATGLSIAYFPLVSIHFDMTKRRTLPPHFIPLVPVHAYR